MRWTIILLGLGVSTTAWAVPPDRPAGRERDHPRELPEHRRTNPRGQISTGMFVGSSAFDAPSARGARNADGKHGGPGSCFKIWTVKFARTPPRGTGPVGMMCSNGAKATAPFQPYHETFLWYSRDAAWKPGQNLYLQVQPKIDAATYTGPTGRSIALTESFDNKEGCHPGAKSVPSGLRYRATGASSARVALVRSGSGSKARLTGYWETSDCEAVAPANDGWISLVPFTDGMTANAWGTAY